MWSESRDSLLKILHNRIFVLGEARHFKFHVLIDILLPKKSRDLFKFWEINDDVSETVQDIET